MGYNLVHHGGKSFLHFLSSFWVQFLHSVRLFLPSEIVGMMLQQLLPWMVAAVAGYGFTAWICIEPQWKQRMLCIVVSVGLLSMLFVSSYPGAYSQFGAGICWILAASFIFPFSSCIRFKYGVQ